MAKQNDIVVGLDIGTTKVAAIVGEVMEDGIDIIGVGSVPSRGLRKGVVINIDSTVQSIQAAVEQAETMAGCEIRTVYAGIAGSHVQGVNNHGVIAIKDKEVSGADVERVLDQAKAMAMPSDRQTIHVLPQEYLVDDQDGIKEPVGMSGVRLEAKVHLVTVGTTFAQNIVRCAERCDLHIAELVLQPLASAEATLSEDEKEIGVAVIDIGGGTTDIVLYVDGSVVHTSVIPLGGLNLTQDISVGLRTPLAEAERIKQKYGCAAESMVDPDETIEVPSVGGRPARVLPRRVLCQIVEPRVEEIFMLVRQAIAATGYADVLASGAVITGGSTVLDGMPELAEQVLGLPVRRGVPTGVGGLIDVVKPPAYSTGVGLVKWGAMQLARGVSGQDARARAERRIETGPGFVSRMGAWFKEVF